MFSLTPSVLVSEASATLLSLVYVPLLLGSVEVYDCIWEIVRVGEMGQLEVLAEEQRTL